MDPRRPLSLAAVAERVRAAAPRLGGTRLVLVDGPAGSGKTTFAGRLGCALGDDAVVVHLEDLYAGWTITGAVARLRAGVLRPLADGRPGAFHRYDWAARRFSPDPTVVPAAPVLLVEGCGSSPRVLDPWPSCGSGWRRRRNCASPAGWPGTAASWSRSGGNGSTPRRPSSPARPPAPGPTCGSTARRRTARGRSWRWS